MVIVLIRGKEMEADEQQLLDALVDRSRYPLIIALLRGGEKYLTQLAKETDMDRGTVTYHLSVLEKVNLVSSEYKILKAPASPGKAARFYKLNKEKLQEALHLIDKYYVDLKKG